MNVQPDLATPIVSSTRASMVAVFDRMMRASPAARSRFIQVGEGRQAHLIEAGEGPPLLHLHGSSTSSHSHLALLDRLPDVWSIAPDRPGCGLSDPFRISQETFRDSAVRFIDDVLDAVRVESVVLAGSSMGGAWAIWYALARPERVRGVVLLGSAPLLPGAVIPVPLRLVTTPVLGELLTRLVRPSRQKVLRLMTKVGEGETLARQPDLLDSVVAGGRHPITRDTNLAELRAVISPRGIRPHALIRDDELRRLTVPTLLIWGDDDPVASVDVAEAAARLILQAQVEVVRGGHVPWFASPDRVAELVSAFTRASSDG